MSYLFQCILTALGLVLLWAALVLHGIFGRRP